MRRAALFLLVMWLNYGLLSVNFRAIAQGRYVAAVATDIAIAVCGWTLFRLIAESGGGVERVGYILGAALGSLTGIYLTRRWSTS